MGTDIVEIVPNFCLLSLDGPKLLAIKQNTPVQIAIRATLFQLSYFTVHMVMLLSFWNDIDYFKQSNVLFVHTKLGFES